MHARVHLEKKKKEIHTYIRGLGDSASVRSAIWGIWALLGLPGREAETVSDRRYRRRNLSSRRANY